MALYHKHRPQTFENVIGQEHIIKTITNQILLGRVAHAYLFSGPRGIGKTTTARLLAKSLSCKNKKEKSFEPCDECEACKEISESRSIDVIEIDAASHTGVDNVRENIIDNAQFRPTKLKYKIFIIDEAHMLSTAAFNALLKIMEEPPEYVVFILATTELHKLPATILSRCQRFDFKKVPYDAMKKHLEKIAKAEGVKIDKEVVDRIINKSDSCVRDAVSLLDQVMATGEKNITAEIASITLPSSNRDEIIKFISYLIHKDAPEAIKQINKITEEGGNLPQFASDTVELLRAMLISKTVNNTECCVSDLGKEAEKELLKLSREIPVNEIINLIDLLLRRRQEIKSSPIMQLPLELMTAQWCQDKNTSTPPTATATQETKSSAPSDLPLENVAPTIQKEEEKIEKIVEVAEEPKEMATTNGSSFTKQDVENKWDEFVSRIEKKSTSVSFILKTSNITNVSNGIIYLSVAFTLHKDRLTNKNGQKDIEDTLSELLGERAKIDVSVSEQAAEETNQDEELQDLTAAFGGEIVG